ncbi:hypothetical protein MTP02_49950 [Streptomyces albus]|nr:hypothetical protein MTP02_49950 [Streptomyces albus]
MWYGESPVTDGSSWPDAPAEGRSAAEAAGCSPTAEGAPEAESAAIAAAATAVLAAPRRIRRPNSAAIVWNPSRVDEPSPERRRPVGRLWRPYGTLPRTGTRR